MASQESISQITSKEELQLHVFLQELVLNALFYGEKCLILSADPEISAKLKVFIQEKGWDSSWIATNLEESRAAAPGTKPAAARIKDPHLYGTKLQKLEGRFHFLNDVYAAVRAPVFGSYTWLELLARYWTSRAQADVELPLSGTLQEGFGFTEAEYSQLNTVLQSAQVLYHDIQALQHPLQQLHPHLFLQQETRPALIWVQQKLKAYQIRVETLAQKYQEKILYYKRDLQQYYERHCAQLVAQAEQILDAIEDAVRQYGGRFLDAKLGNRAWLITLSGQSRLAHLTYQELVQQYDKVKQHFHSLHWFVFHWPKTEKNKAIKFVQESLVQLIKALKEQQRNLPQFAQEEALRLSSKSAPATGNNHTQVAALEEEMEELLQELNETELLAQPLTHQMLTLAKRQQFLRQVQQQLEQLLQSTTDFEAFHPWQKFYSSLNAPAQNLIKALVENRSQHWADTFSAWYLQQVLLSMSYPDAARVSLQVQSYHQTWAILQDLAPAHWQARRRKILETQEKQEAFDQYTHLSPILCLPYEDWTKLTAGAHFHWLVVLGNTNPTAEQLEAYCAKATQVVLLTKTEQAIAPKIPQLHLDAPAQALKTTEGFWLHVLRTILPYFAAETWLRNLEWEGLRLPLVLQTSGEKPLKVVFIADGFLAESSATDFAWEYQQQQRLQDQGWKIIPVWSKLCWQNLPEECRKIAAQIILWEKQNRD